MTIGERIQMLRKQKLNLTQEEFAKRINVGRANVASIERGRIAVTDRVVSDICNAFSISEEWLREGKGEMLQDAETTLFANFAKQYNLTPAEQNVTRFFLTLPPEERQQMLKYVTMLADAINGGEQEQPQGDAYIKAETEAYRQELEAEQSAKGKLHHSEDTDGIIA